MGISKNYLLIFTGILLGAVGGYLYWYFIGCISGSCSITSVWYKSSAYGAVMGALISGVLFDHKSDKRKHD